MSVDMKRALMDESADNKWQKALVANKMSKVADRSRRNAEDVRRNHAAEVIQVCWPACTAGPRGVHGAVMRDMPGPRCRYCT